MVQAMVIYYGLMKFASLRLPLIVASMVIVGSNTGAYMAEIMRSGIISVDKGQTEAAVSLGMTHWQTMSSVILPQAIRNVLPSVGNEFVVNVKDTSVLNVIAVSELYFVGNMALDSLEDVSYSTEKGYAVNGAPVKTGPVNDLSLIGDCPYLVSLALIDQSAGSLKELSGLVLLKELYLCGCEEADLTGLTDLPGLKTLHLEHSGIRDLTPLTAFKRLKTVTVSTDMLPLALNADADFDILLEP